jgi:hypothetical protein
MDRDELKRLLDRSDDESFVQERLLGATPWIFHERHATYETWRTELGRVSGLPGKLLFIVGSAAVGYSLSPLKPGRPFRALAVLGDASDIDLAAVSAELFLSAWDTIVAQDQRRVLRLTRDDVQRMRQDIYWGYILDRHLPANTEPSRAIRRIIAEVGRTPPFRGHRVRVRVYRRLTDLKAYHVYSLRSLRRTLAE